MLVSHLGDIAAMQLSSAARQSDQVDQLIGGGVEKKAGDPAAQTTTVPPGPQKSVLIHEPPLGVNIKIADKEVPATALYISGKGIQCLVEFREFYLDLAKGANLDLTLHFEDREQVLNNIRCKTIRNTIQKWNSRLIPVQLKIDWGFYKLDTEQQESINRFIEFCATSSHPAS